MKTGHPSYIILWKFRPKKGREKDFESAYGPNGGWVQLFKKAKGFIKTELYQNGDGSYLTVDEWESEEAYEQFKAQNQNEYQDLDSKYQSLTDEEVFIGTSTRSTPDEIF